MQAQVECGTLCPTTMTYGAIAAMRRDPGLARDWVPRLLTRALRSARHPDRAQARRPDRHGHDGETRRLGRARQHDARRAHGATGRYRITGHKWFFSAPQCDAHLVLAQAEGGLSCFFMPRRLPDGTRNAHLHPAPQGQARQPLQRLLRSRVRRCVGAACSARKAAAFRPSSRWAPTRGSTA